MSARVVDASVMAAVAFGEPRRDEAVALLDRAEVLGPTLLAYELTHVACKKCRARPEEAVRVASQLNEALTLTDRWLEVDAGEVLALALVWGLSAYDASYLWLAGELRVPLVTFDRRLEAVASEMGLS